MSVGLCNLLKWVSWSSNNKRASQPALLFLFKALFLPAKKCPSYQTKQTGFYLTGKQIDRLQLKLVSFLWLPGSSSNTSSVSAKHLSRCLRLSTHSSHSLVGKAVSVGVLMNLGLNDSSFKARFLKAFRCLNMELVIKCDFQMCPRFGA